MFKLFAKTYDVLVCERNRNILYTIKGSRDEALEFAKSRIGDETWRTCTHVWKQKMLVVWV